MVSLSLWHHLQILTCILLLTRAYCEDERKTYIVYMGDHPKGIFSAELLHMSMVQTVLRSKFAPDALLHSYEKSFNGFVVKLTKEEAVKMAGLDGVISVFLNKKNKFKTTRSWDFIGFPENVKRTSTESDIIVGVIDYGIWPESASFNDEGFGPPPSKWKGSCHNFTCNNKLIGAKYFRMEGSFEKDDIISPRDPFGHGTHCASVATGNPIKSTSFFNYAYGTVRGGVPSARVAAYKTCWSLGCDDVDILHAFDEAIADGVDIISISLGPAQVTYTPYFEDVFAIGAFHAMKRGILTANSAGNEGPARFSISNNAPWLLSVAASTMGRKFVTRVRLGDGKFYEGVSLNTFDLKSKSYPLIYGGDAPNITGGYNSSISRLCLLNSLDKDLVKGKIVLCDGFQGTTAVGLASGAAGIIIRTLRPKDVAFTFALPAVLLSLKDGTLIFSYINSTSNPTATIFKSNEGNDTLAPYIPSFSSRGPNAITPNILKPDLAAPGVHILAAWSGIGPVSDVEGDDRVAKYNIESGTSMACPHVAAAAAYVKSFNPTWSPAAIKSALMTTATPLSVTLNPEAELAYGAGQIDPIKAIDPGLVYDASDMDYVKFLCGQGYDRKKLQAITSDNSTCAQTNNETARDLNLPSFALSTNTSTYFSSIFHRTVTNVGLATSTYKAKITAPPSLLNIKVEPDVLSFSFVGEKKTFILRIEGMINVDVVSSSLVWDDGTFQVKTPIVVYAT